MKLLVAVLEPEKAGQATDALVRGGFGVTRLPTAGGFLRRGNATLLAGVEEGWTDAAVALVRLACGRPRDAAAGHGPLFVLPVASTVRL